MPEAVIVSTARSPIGRANKGSLKDMRPDDLTAQMVRAALDKVPALDPHDIDDLILGCGLPGGESGNNMGRIVVGAARPRPRARAPRSPATAPRRCRPRRMAFHAIKAGEGDVFVSAGVETVSRFAKGTSDHLPDTRNPKFEEAARAHRQVRRGRPGLARPPRGRHAAGRLHRDGPDRRERRPAQGAHPPGARRVRRAQPEPRREGDRRRLLGQGDHPGDAPRRHGRRAPTTARAPA